MLLQSSFATSCSELWAVCSELCSAEKDETTFAETDEQLCIYFIESTKAFLCRRIVLSLPLPSEFPQ